MSREWATERRSGGWLMRCDKDGCPTVSDIRARCEDLPLEEFAQSGWYIARTHGDRCPACVAAEGGLNPLCIARQRKGGPGEPHSVMAGAA